MFDGVQERLVGDGAGDVFHFVKTQQADEIIRAVAGLRDNIKKDTGPGKGRLLGSVPILMAQIWAKECGERVGTKAWVRYAKKKLQSNEYQKLQVHGL